MTKMHEQYLRQKAMLDANLASGDYERYEGSRTYGLQEQQYQRSFFNAAAAKTREEQAMMQEDARAFALPPVEKSDDVTRDTSGGVVEFPRLAA